MEEPKRIVRRFFDEAMTKKFAELCSDLNIAAEVIYGAKWNIADKVTTEHINSKLRHKLNAQWIELTMEKENV